MNSTVASLDKYFNSYWRCYTSLVQNTRPYTVWKANFTRLHDRVSERHVWMGSSDRRGANYKSWRLGITIHGFWLTNSVQKLVTSRHGSLLMNCVGMCEFFFHASVSSYYTLLVCIFFSSVYDMSYMIAFSVLVIANEFKSLGHKNISFLPLKNTLFF